MSKYWTPSKHCNIDLPMQRLAVWDHCIEIHVFYFSTKEAARQRWGYLCCSCRSCASNQTSYPVLSFILNLILGRPQTPSLHGLCCLSSPHRPASLPLKGLTESSKKCEGEPPWNRMRDLLVSTSNGTSHELLHSVRNNLYLLTFVTLFLPLPRAILYHHQLCELRLLLNWNFLKKEKREKERMKEKEKAISLLQQAYW